MARGGRRPGAGRKPGAATAKTREVADRAAEEGITPLEVMLGAMRELWDGGKKQDAATIAKDAAPYMHPRLSNISQEVTGANGGPLVPIINITGRSEPPSAS